MDGRTYGLNVVKLHFWPRQEKSPDPNQSIFTAVDLKTYSWEIFGRNPRDMKNLSCVNNVFLMTPPWEK